MSEMTDALAEGQETQVQAERRGRGPTRPAIVAADLIDDVIGGKVDLDAVIQTLDSTTTSKEMRATSRSKRETLRETIRRTEAELVTDEEIAELLERAERLPPAMRAFVIAALRGEADARSAVTP